MSFNGATGASHEFHQSQGDFDLYLKGNGIDIGAGNDPLVIPSGSVRAWDRGDGDAMLMAGVPDCTYDFVYSSHCLEHMVDVRVSLFNWSRILKSGGYLYTVVPDWELYEHEQWGSAFNADHKHSFSLTKRVSGRTNHFIVPDDLSPMLTGLELVTCRLEDHRYDYSRKDDKGYDQTTQGHLAQICIIYRKP